jgi:hypothetical protein
VSRYRHHSLFLPTPPTHADDDSLPLLPPLVSLKMLSQIQDIAAALDLPTSTKDLTKPQFVQSNSFCTPNFNSTHISLGSAARTASSDACASVSRQEQASCSPRNGYPDRFFGRR